MSHALNDHFHPLVGTLLGNWGRGHIITTQLHKTDTQVIHKTIWSTWQIHISNYAAIEDISQICQDEFPILHSSLNLWYQGIGICT